MNKSSLFEKRPMTGVEFGEYFGWKQPKYYTRISEEYWAAKENIVLMHRPYFGMLRITGADHSDLLHRMTTNELHSLKPHGGQLNLFTNEKGRIIDRVLLHKYADEIRLVTSPSNSNNLKTWIEKFVFVEDVNVDDLTDNFELLTLIGPQCLHFLNSVFDDNFDELPNFYYKLLKWAGTDFILTRFDELNIPAFTLVSEKRHIYELWNLLVEKGATFDLKPMGEAAYEILRIEAGWPILNHDFDATVNPHEAGMLPYVNFNKGCYIGQEVIARLDTYDKVQKRLAGIIFEGEILPDEHAVVLFNGAEIGKLTSVTHSIALNKFIALAYVRSKFIQQSDRVSVNFNNQKITGKLIELPFIKST